MSVAIAHVVLLLAVGGGSSAEIVWHAAVDAMAAPFSEPPVVVSRSLPQMPDAAKVGALAAAAKADAVVILSCVGDGCTEADLRVIADGRAQDRSVHFSAGDAPGERGRAIGLLAGTLLREAWSGTSETSASAVEVAPPGIATSASGGPKAVAPPATSWAAELAAGLFVGGASNTPDAGFTLALHYLLVGNLALRVGAKLELGDLSDGAGTFRTLGPTVGLAWTSRRLMEPGRFGGGFRADFVAVFRQVRLTQAAADNDDSDSAALGGDAVAMIGYALSAGAVLTASTGVELLKIIAVDADDVHASGPAALRLVAELGVLARF